MSNASLLFLANRTNIPIKEIEKAWRQAKRHARISQSQGPGNNHDYALAYVVLGAALKISNAPVLSFKGASIKHVGPVSAHIVISRVSFQIPSSLLILP